MGPLSRLEHFVAKRTDARLISLLRPVAAVNALICAVETSAQLFMMTRPQAIRLPYAWNFHPPTGDWMAPYMIVWVMAALLFLIGYGTRFAGTVLVVIMGYTLIMDQQTYTNHLYLVVLEVLYLVLGNSGAYYSLDARQPAINTTTPVWVTTLWKLQISIVYFFAAISKINRSFLSGQALRTYWYTGGWLSFMEPLLDDPTILAVLSCSAICVELFIALALWSGALRRFALIAGLCVHLSMFLILGTGWATIGITVFILATLPSYSLFFATDNQRSRRSPGPSAVISDRQDLPEDH